MLNKRILTLVFVVAFLTLLVGCIPQPTNQVPVITSIPITVVDVGEDYTYDVNATDPDGDTLRYSLTLKPKGMTINSDTGLIKWTPTKKGNYHIVVKVSDGDLDITQSFTIVVSEVSPGYTPPCPTPPPTPSIQLTSIVVEPKEMTLFVGESETIKSVTATYEIKGFEVPIPLGYCTYKSDNTGVATVAVGNRNNGAFTVLAVGEGTADIVVSYKGKFDTIEVTVKVRYSFTDTQPVSDKTGGTVGNLVTTVTEDHDWIIWTFDFPVEEFKGDGNLNVGLIIATDGDGYGPAFQIHNNDGATLVEPHGTWMYGSWGPTITDGWMGWPDHDLDVPIAGLDWVSATGNRNIPHGDGVMEIRIKKSELGNTFHWAASPTVGTGFWDAYDITMQIPTDFDWGTPIVDMNVPNYIAR